jgi:hypothetical protein
LTIFGDFQALSGKISPPRVMSCFRGQDGQDGQDGVRTVRPRLATVVWWRWSGGPVVRRWLGGGVRSARRGDEFGDFREALSGASRSPGAQGGGANSEIFGRRSRAPTLVGVQGDLQYSY